MVRQHLYPSTGALVGSQVNSAGPRGRGPQPRAKVVNVSDVEMQRAICAMNEQMVGGKSSEEAEAIAWEKFPDPNPESE